MTGEYLPRASSTRFGIIKLGTGLTYNATTGAVDSSAGGGTLASSVTTETAFGQASAVGVSSNLARADHTHGTPTDPVPAHVAAVDPHTQYALESALGTMAIQSAGSVSITGGSITGITDLAVADGGTGASTAGDARTNLGLGSIATQASSAVSITGGSITGITDLAIADGGTGAGTATAAFNNLSPLTTKGDLLTSDGSNNVRQAVGTNEHILRADSAQTNGIKWSIERSTFDAVIGTGGDYSTVKSAIDAGKSRLLIISNTTETANIDIVAAAMPNLYIFIEAGVNLDLGAYRFTDTGTLTSVTVEGQGTITYAHTVANEELFDFAGGKLILSGLTIDNNSTNSGCHISVNAIEIFTDLRIEVPNQTQCGIDNSFNSGCRYTRIEIVGGGTSCVEAIFVGNANFTDLLLSGTFTSTASGSYAVDIENSNILNFIIGISTNPITCFLSASIATNVINDFVTHLVTINGAYGLTNINDVNGGGIALVSCVSVSNAFGSLINLSNCSYVSNTSATTVDPGNLDNVVYSNVSCTTLDLTDASSLESKYTNVRVTNAVTIAGDLNKFTNCDFLGGATVPSGGNNNGFVNCQFGADAGGGALTITVAAGANNTRIIGCMTDAAISDSGTNTVSVGNSVY